MRSMVEGGSVGSPSTAFGGPPPPQLRCNGGSSLLLRVPGGHPRAAGEQRLDGRQPGARQTIDRIMLAGEGPGGDHLILRVERPASASTKLMIQKRITTVGSDQPKCSKWWWIGAIRKTRLPVRLYTRTWMTTESASTTKIPPTMTRANSW